MNEKDGRADAVTAFAPGSVGNVICGFDVLGLALERPGDRVTAHGHDAPDVRVTAIEGDGGRLPHDPARNTAAAAARALLGAAGVRTGVALRLQKGLPLSAGMGGSAASAAAAVVAVDALLQLGSGPDRLLAAALEGERVASGATHPDNVAACLRGGIVLARASAVRPVVSLPVPHGLAVALLHPHVEIDTREARRILGATVAIEDAVWQMGNVGAFVAGLFRNDRELLGDALGDRIAEPRRTKLVPGFGAVREAALAAGALGCGLSGAGPSIVAICADERDADRVGAAMREGFAAATELDADLHVSPVATRGARVVDGAP